jgi:hypothetical protein
MRSRRSINHTLTLILVLLLIEQDIAGYYNLKAC